MPGRYVDKRLGTLHMARLPGAAAIVMDKTDQTLKYVDHNGDLQIVASSPGPTGRLVNVTQFSMSPAGVGANTTAVTTVAHAFMLDTDIPLVVTPPGALDAGLAIGHVRIPAAGQVSVAFINVTAGMLTPVSGVYTLSYLRVL